MTDLDRPLAVVTGASGSIGTELIRQFTKHEFEVLAGGDELATADGVEHLHAQVRHRHVAALALNAAITPGANELDLIDLNVRSLVQLARLLTNEMAAHGRGRVLVTAAVMEPFAALHHAGHTASKAFAHTFAACLREELRDRGVSVTVLEGEVDDPAVVAAEAFEALMAGRETVTARSSHPITRLPGLVTSRLASLAKR